MQNVPATRQQLITELLTQGVQVINPQQEHVSRHGGAGPSDHQAMNIDGVTVMVPIYTHSAHRSPWQVKHEASGTTRLYNLSIPVKEISIAHKPRFYDRQTADGIPATLHGTDVLATTVLQTCIRYENRAKACQFCAIGQSLAAGSTIARKTPQQLAEVAKAAVELDSVKHMVMTTGTPSGSDRGARILVESAAAIKAAVDLPLQGQCEPPGDAVWFQRMKDAGIDALGMHLEAVTPAVRARIMPGKAQVSVEQYLIAFADAVAVFGRGQVSTYILAGLGDTPGAILSLSETLIDLGVYPFVVPFVPISGTPLEHHAAPDSTFMTSILQPLGQMLNAANLRSSDIKAGCGRCGACSSLSSFEQATA
ncbi:MSMEG_0568 family radical SAM protein [Pantoea rodasii]|uniref:MSMEG_0568 family radical SAM protein n=1 Tax=Pantoea rodasii TaxID=1076549 RepID=A0A2M9W5U3_9GAMM|nr:MSMEG_0568 family radical SAM protein [Pantoea rodasii]ORM65365.1 radical SAM protein [Pantoea rodasii]PJZ02913.1 MSMEG_0568 family radical SAM protein [Pantoea rodasii]